MTRREVSHKEAQEHLLAYLQGFLDGECEPWETAVVQGTLDSAVVFHSATIDELSSKKNGRCRSLLALAQATGYLRTPEDLWRYNGEKLAQVGLNLQNPRFQAGMVHFCGQIG